MSELSDDLNSRVFVGYEPMADEPDFRTYLSAHGLPEPSFIIPPSKDLAPDALAEELAKKFAGANVAVFVPGRRFDHTGTRHGRGHGWYDRFFAAAPAEWLRVGVSGDEHFSTVALLRKEWDEPMDWVLLEKNGAFETIETKAR